MKNKTTCDVCGRPAKHFDKQITVKVDEIIKRGIRTVDEFEDFAINNSRGRTKYVALCGYHSPIKRIDISTENYNKQFIKHRLINQ